MHQWHCIANVALTHQCVVQWRLLPPSEADSCAIAPQAQTHVPARQRLAFSGAWRGPRTARQSEPSRLQSSAWEVRRAHVLHPLGCFDLPPRRRPTNGERLAPAQTCFLSCARGRWRVLRGEVARGAKGNATRRPLPSARRRAQVAQRSTGCLQEGHTRI